jgi:hypothetical protein
MPAPKGRFPPARQNAVPEHTEPLRMSQCWMRRTEWPLKVAPETIDRRDGQPMCMIAWMRSKSPESQNLGFYPPSLFSANYIICGLSCCPLKCGSQERTCVAGQHRQTHQD